jgi:hypothetical protein
MGAQAAMIISSKPPEAAFWPVNMPSKVPTYFRFLTGAWPELLS